MSIDLPISALRQAIDRSAPAPLLDRLFQETFAILRGPDPNLNLRAAIRDVEPNPEDWQRALVNHTYQRLIGPHLREQQARLHHLTDQVLVWWDAVEEMCNWLAEQLSRLNEQGQTELRLPDYQSLTAPPEPLWLEDPGWREALQLTGLDELRGALCRPAAESGSGWVAVTLQTGPRTPEAEAALGALFHLLLKASGEYLSPGDRDQRPDRTLTLVSFTPHRVERHFTAAELREAEEGLRQMAGIASGAAGNSRPDLPEWREWREWPEWPVLTSAGKNDPPLPTHAELGAGLLAICLEHRIQLRLEPTILTGPALLRFTVITGIGPGEKALRRAIERLAREIQTGLKLPAPPRPSSEGGRLVIDLPRPDRQVVTFDAIREQLPASDPLTGSPRVPLGVDLNGRLRLIDFSRPENAHLLIAGSDASGKNGWLRTALAGLCAVNTPATLRLLLIGSTARGSSSGGLGEVCAPAFLLQPLVPPHPGAAEEALHALGDEMERRCRLMEEHGVDSVGAVSARTGQPIPRIFGIIDEYAALIRTDRLTRRAIERQITRLGQRARAAGIHLIIATEHPGREIIRGTLDANFPSRIAFRMEKAIESKLLLNQPGAETLLGDGDLLFRDGGESIRLQAVGE